MPVKTGTQIGTDAESMESSTVSAFLAKGAQGSLSAQIIYIKNLVKDIASALTALESRVAALEG